jgi:hypothetical protein
MVAKEGTTNFEHAARLLKTVERPYDTKKLDSAPADSQTAVGLYELMVLASLWMQRDLKDPKQREIFIAENVALIGARQGMHQQHPLEVNAQNIKSIESGDYLERAKDGLAQAYQNAGLVSGGHTAAELANRFETACNSSLDLALGTGHKK